MKGNKGYVVAGTVFAVTVNGMLAGGKLHSYLMRSSRVKPYSYKGKTFFDFQHSVFKGCFFYALSFALYNE